MHVNCNCDVMSCRLGLLLNGKGFPETLNPVEENRKTSVQKRRQSVFFLSFDKFKT